MENVDNNELEAFVSSTLLAISRGISAEVSSGKFTLSSPIKFEVAVTATKELGREGRLKLQVFQIGGKQTTNSGTENRVVFEVAMENPNAGGPISYPNKGVV